MADINAQNLPVKWTASVSWDKVIILDSQDGNKLKIQSASLFQWPQGTQGVQWPTWATGATWPQWPTGSTWVQWPTWPSWVGISSVTSDKVWLITTVTVTKTDSTSSQFQIQDGSGWDMYMSTYDTNNSWVVDDAEHLGWQLPSYYAPATHTHTFASITGKPTTISGYGITDAYTKTEIVTQANAYAKLTGWNTFSWDQDINGAVFVSWWSITARNAKFFSWDLNTLSETWPHTANNPTNKPSWSTTWGYVEVMRWSTNSGYVLQRWTDMEWAIPWIWVRTLRNATWDAWVQISWPWLDFTPTASVIQSIAWARYKIESKKVFINIKMTVNVTSDSEFAFSGLPVATTTNHTVLQVRLRQGFGSTIYWASAEPSGTSSMYVSVHSPLTSFPSWNWDVYISGFYEIA